MITREQQDWHDRLKGMFSVPDPTAREVREGGVFVRTLGKRCPICRDVFFSYQREGHERQPYLVDVDPPEGKGARETCGHPKCHDAEDHYQWQRRLGFRDAAAKARAQHQHQAKPLVELVLL